MTLWTTSMKTSIAMTINQLKFIGISPFYFFDTLSLISCLGPGLPQWLSSKEFACNAGDAGLVPGSGRSLGVGNRNLLQYSCLENSMDGGDLRAMVHRVAKSQTELMWLYTYNTNDTNNLLRSWPQWEWINYDTDTWNNRKGYGLDEAPWILCFEIYGNKSLKLLFHIGFHFTRALKIALLNSPSKGIIHVICYE